MDSLPLELKQRICSLLTPNDLKALRLVSSHYSVAACRYILPRIHIFNRSESFQEIQDICDHPELRKNVKTLVVDVSRLSSYPSLNHWRCSYLGSPSLYSFETWKPVTARPTEDPNKDGIDLRASRASQRAKIRDRQAFEEAPYVKDWQAYNRLSKFQALQSSRAIMLDRISRAFSMCPKLNNLVVTYGSEQCPDGSLKKRNRMFHDIVPTVWRERLDATKVSLWDIFKCAEKAQRGLNSLWLFHSAFDPSAATDSTVLHALKHLRLSLQDVDDGHTRATQNMINILRSTSKLETIKIVGSDRNLFDIPGVLQTIRSISLRQCTLEGFIATENDMVEFFLRHAGSLQILGLKSIHFEAPASSWSSFASRLAGRLLQLKNLFIHSYDMPGLEIESTIKPLCKRSLRSDHSEPGLEEDYEELFDGRWDYDARWDYTEW